MLRIQFPFSLTNKDELVVEFVECVASEWAERPEGLSDWSICHPEPGSPDGLIRAVRILGADSARCAGPVLRLVGT